jgi:hypothetical protein
VKAPDQRPERGVLTTLESGEEGRSIELAIAHGHAISG